MTNHMPITLIEKEGGGGGEGGHIVEANYAFILLDWDKPFFRPTWAWSGEQLLIVAWIGFPLRSMLYNSARTIQIDIWSEMLLSKWKTLVPGNRENHSFVATAQSIFSHTVPMGQLLHQVKGKPTLKTKLGNWFLASTNQTSVFTLIFIQLYM